MTTQSITSIGSAAAQLQCPISKILATAARLEIKPAISINSIVHFDDRDLERIADHVRDDRQPKESE